MMVWVGIGGCPSDYAICIYSGMVDAHLLVRALEPSVWVIVDR